MEAFYPMVLELGKRELSSGATCIAPRIRCREERKSNESSDFSKEDLIEFLPTVEISFWPDEVNYKKNNKVRLLDLTVFNYFSNTKDSGLKCQNKMPNKRLAYLK